MRKNLRSARKKKGYTQAELAMKLGITTNQLQRLEAGTSDGSMKVWQHLKMLLGAETIDFLLEQEEDLF